MSKAQESNFATDEHSRLGASSASRWLACPGSIRMSKDAPKQESSIYAQEGTAAHKLAELCLRLDMNPIDMIGQSIMNDDKSEFIIDDEMANAVQEYYNVIQEYVSKEGATYSIEQRFQLGWIDKECFGTNDFTVYVPEDKMLVVIDYKHGKGVPVEAATIEIVDGEIKKHVNKQLMFYAAGARKTFPKCDLIRLVVCQPRAPHGDGPTRAVDITNEELDAFEKVLGDGIRAVRAPNASLKAGDHCRWCPAQAICPELHNIAMQRAQAVFDPVVQVFQLPDAQSLSKADIVRVLQSMDILQSWLAAVAKHAEHLATTGENIEGFKLVRKRTNRTWRDPDIAKMQLIEQFGDQVLKKPELKGLTEIQNILKKELKLKNASEAEKALEPYVYKPMGEVTLAPETDKRSAIPNGGLLESPFGVIGESAETPTQQPAGADAVNNFFN